MTKLMGVEPAEPQAHAHAEYPKWVVPHGSHLDGTGHGGFADMNKDRGGNVTVLVHDATEEERALAPKGGAAGGEAA